MDRLKPSVSVRAPAPAARGPAAPASGAGQRPFRLGWPRIVLAALAFGMFGMVSYAVFYSDHQDLSPDARIGFIGAIIGYAAASVRDVIAFCFPQND